MAEDYAVIVSSTIVGMTVVVPLKVEALILWLPITFKEISFSHSLADLTTKKLTTKTGLITRCLEAICRTPSAAVSSSLDELGHTD
jgi:hypothetical protein